MKRLALLLTLPLLLVFGTTARAGDVRIRKVLPQDVSLCGEPANDPMGGVQLLTRQAQMPHEE